MVFVFSITTSLAFLMGDGSPRLKSIKFPLGIFIYGVTGIICAELSSKDV